MYFTSFLLGLAQFLLMASVAVSLSFSGLVGAKLAPSQAMATFPFLFATGTTALLTLPLPGLFSRFGYRQVFVAGAALGFVGGLVCAWALWLGSFSLFCLGCVLAGVYQASALYYRFAAADSVDTTHKGQAIAWVLSGGILAALLGPWLGSRGLALSADQSGVATYLGAYLLTCGLTLIAVLLLAFLRTSTPHRAASGSAPVSLGEVLRHPVLLPAIMLCGGGYAVMMFVMLSSPLAMSHCGYQPEDAASVIQWHLLGMFAPSLVTGRAITRYGAKPVAQTGCVLLALACVLALTSESLPIFHLALLGVGVGWNLMYMGGSTLLSLVEERLRGRLQAANEFATYAVMTFTAGATGWFYFQWGWFWVLVFSLMLLTLIASTLFVASRSSVD